MNQAPNLIVPIHLLALCTGQETAATLMGPTATFAGFPSWPAGSAQPSGKPYLSSSVTSFPDSSATPGVHLHWSLPDALTRAQHDRKSGDVTFPPVPNRWLLSRISTRDDDPTPRIKSWVIESNQQRTVDNGQGCPTMPYNDTEAQQQYFRHMGGYADYDQWQESECDNALTAVGYGEPSFAAYYPNCRNVFGFFDDFRLTLGQSDADGGGTDSDDPLLHAHTLSYFVLGWFAQANIDPLAGTAVDGDANSWSWGFSEGTPAATLCSALIRNVSWIPGTDYLDNAVSTLDVAVGNSGAEALAAMVAHQGDMAADHDTEYLLNAVQRGLFTQLHNDTGKVAKLDLTLHQSEFSSEAGGTVWALKPCAASHFGSDSGDASHDTPTLAAPLASALERLNLAQAAYDKANFDIASLRRQVFNDWYRIQLLANGTTPINAPNIDIQAVQSLADDAVDAVKKLQTSTGNLEYTRAQDVDTPLVQGPYCAGTLAQAVVDAYSALAAPTVYLLQRTPAPRFWLPNDPVVLLRGADVGPTERFGAAAPNGLNGYLPCRLSGQTSASLAYGDAATLDALDITSGKSYARLPPAVAGDALDLLAEAMCLDSRFAQRLAGALCAKDGQLKQAEVASDLAALCLAADAGTLATAAVCASGISAYPPARSNWTGTPWNPLFLRWQLVYSPLAGKPVPTQDWQFDPKLIVAHHTLNGDAIELQMCPDAAPTMQAAISGITPLAHGALANLQAAIDAVLKGDPAPDKQLVDIREHLQDLPLLSQALGGFHRALNGQFQNLQVNLCIAFQDDPFTDRCAAAVVDFNDAAPVSDDSDSVRADWDSLFAPVRTGLLSLGDLSIYDSFGQVRKVVPASCAWSHALQTDDGRIVLPPRLSQPARLLFRWLGAGTSTVQMNPMPDTSPICGWVIPNHIDDGLMVFDAAGVPLGELCLVGKPQLLTWRPAPTDGGAVIAPQTDPGQERALIAGSIADPVLRGFALGMFDGGAGYFASMLAAIDRAISTILPAAGPQDPAIALLMRRALALSCAQVALDLKGIVSPDQSWEALQSDTTAQAAPSQRQTRAFGAVTFPLRLGDLSQTDDGLVGYFSLAGTANDFASFYSPAVTEDGDGIVNSDRTTLFVTPGGPALTIAMLHDPRAQVHATSAILPVNAIALPSEQYAAALDSLAVYFYAGPLLMSASGAPLQLPKLNSFAWAWRQAIDGRWQQRLWTGVCDDRMANGDDPLHLAEGWVAMVPAVPAAAKTSVPS